MKTESAVIETPYLNSDEAWQYLKFPTKAAFYIALRRQGIPYYKRGKSLLFERGQLDAWLKKSSLRVVSRRRAKR